MKSFVGKYMGLYLRPCRIRICPWSDHWNPIWLAVNVSQMLLKASPCTAVYLTRYSDGIMGAIASQITSLTVVYSMVYSDADQRKHPSSASLAFVRGIHRWPVNAPHKWPVARKMFPYDDVIMIQHKARVYCAFFVVKQFPHIRHVCCIANEATLTTNGIPWSSWNS